VTSRQRLWSAHALSPNYGKRREEFIFDDDVMNLRSQLGLEFHHTLGEQTYLI
jgi:hypothetical protein